MGRLVTWGLMGVGCGQTSLSGGLKDSKSDEGPIGDFALAMAWLRRLTAPVVGARFLVDPGAATGPRP